MALTGIEIYKLLPKTNCKKCGFPTCLAFAMQLAQKKVELSKCPDVSEEAMRTHLQSVHLALSSRIALIRIVSVVATGAAGLAIKAAVPGGQLLLLPAVWRFVRDALEELRQSWPHIQHLR